MRVLLLGPERPELEEYLASLGDEVARADKRLTPKSAKLRSADWIVSYGYRHILKPEVLDLMPDRIINLHISLLPWNRGADPNLWSFLEDTPKGVTIHRIDAGIDTGDILAQEEVSMRPDDTLWTSYERLSAVIVDLFRRTWPDIRAGKQTARKQPEGGSVHRLSDRAACEHLLQKGWDTPVRNLIGRAPVDRSSNELENGSHED